MKYRPANVPRETSQLAEYLQRELQRIANADQEVVLYRTLAADAGTLSSGVSANWRIAAGNVVRISTSNTLTLTGLALSPNANRELALINVGNGVLVLLSENAGSSASNRFALPTTWQLSANAAAVLWYDAASSRLRGLGRT